MSVLSSRVEEILASIIAGEDSGVDPKSRVEALLNELNTKIQALAGEKDWIGITTTSLYDGSSTNPIVINGSSVTAVAGNVTSYNDVEFIFNGTIWQEYGRKIKVSTITLGTTWSGSDPYTQSVTVSGETITTNSKVDLQLTAAQMQTLIDDGVMGLTIENDNGSLTAYCLGATPSSSMTVQCTVTDVAV